ncbi:SGNH/GDSL hydrolase family protein [Reichenbachiella agariperforans]|uniref:SGNH/GDSL hydrolase family protein n=1 Tax=Reichenbachiella agariperforans TaxID=156994 RepID=UPI0020915F32|nr:SGNH/GDSL hydrolase family protein [Reichenbachiella agariperforans]
MYVSILMTNTMNNWSMKIWILGWFLLVSVACQEESGVQPAGDTVAQNDKDDQSDETDEVTDEEEQVDVPPATSELSYLALGDSYTIGQSVAEEDRWPVQLVAELKSEGQVMSAPKIIARTGWTTTNLIHAMDQEKELSARYDLVSLLIGVNNQYQRQPIERFTTEYPILLDRAIALAGGEPKRVVVLSIPDYGVTPFGQSADPERIAGEIDEYNRMKKQMTENKGVIFFDITEISREAKSNPSLIAVDGLHPSGQMYARWVETVLPWITEELKP